MIRPAKLRLTALLTSQLFLFSSCTVVTIGSFNYIPKFTAWTAESGREVPRHFVVLVSIGEESGSQKQEIREIKLPDIPLISKSGAIYSFLLSTPKGELRNDDQSLLLRWEAKDISHGKQQIIIETGDDDYTFTITYEASEKEINPMRLETMEPGVMFASMFLGIITWVILAIIGFVLVTIQKSRKIITEPTSGSTHKHGNKILRILALVSGSVFFFPVSCTTALYVGTHAMAKLDERDISKGDSPHDSFKIVGVDFNIPPGAGDRRKVIELKDLSKIKNIHATSNPFIFLLTGPGTDELSPEFSEEFVFEENMNVKYHIITSPDKKEQTTEVYTVTSNYPEQPAISKYNATRDSVTPLYSKQRYPEYFAEQVFPYALAFAALILGLGRLIERRYLIISNSTNTKTNI